MCEYVDALALSAGFFSAPTVMRVGPYEDVCLLI